MSLIEKIRKARLHPVEVGEVSFTVRRPTDLEIARIGKGGITPFDVVLRFTVGWKVKESDVVSDGGEDFVPWDADLFAEWVVDRPDLWEPLANKVMETYTEHRTRMEANTKN